jgi:hypothetical protein
MSLLRNAFRSLFEGTFTYKLEAYLFRRSRFGKEILTQLEQGTRKLEEAREACAGLKDRLRVFQTSDGVMPPGARIGLVSTMPRSGTWYNSYFFRFYDQLVRGRTPQEIVANVKANPRLTESAIHYYGDTIGLGAFFLMHFHCPGFRNYHGEFRAAWEELSNRMSDVSTNTGAWAIQRNATLLDPCENPTVRIVYIFRNPLDQAVSFFRHAQNHVLEEVKYTRDETGNKIYFSSPRDYLFRGGLELFLKQFITFREMHSLHPDNILILTYEDSVRDPRTHFETMLRFFGHDPNRPRFRESFEKALTLAGIKSIKGIENAVGRSLGDDQKDSDSRHIRDGSVGQWRQHFDSGDLAEIDARLSVFRMSITDFDLGEDASPHHECWGSDR